METRTATAESREIRNLGRIREYLGSGCDERIYPDAHGRNRYGIDVMDHRDLVHRGSCTCGTLNDDNLRLLNDLLDEDLEDTAAYENLLERQSRNLKALINYDGQDEFEIFYGPSGSDLAYLPGVFARILHPGKPVLNIVSCPEELGSGTLHAARAKFHAEYNQFGEAVPKGAAVSAGLEAETIFLPARGDDGRIINHEAFIREQIDAHTGHAVIVSLVYGSKSGIEDNLGLIDKIDRPHVIWSVDMCQFRHSRSIIHRLLDKQACIMITGSKFYQAPPFCGAMLVSRPFLDRIAKGPVEEFGKLGRIFSGYDLPVALRGIVALEKQKNIGLRLRWACSLNEISKFRALPRERVQITIAGWNDFVTRALEASNAFELMPDQGQSNRTIISFRVKSGGRYLDHDTLRRLYRETVTTGRIGTADGRKRVFFGQPVAYGERSFLRTAIGSMCIREFIDAGTSDFGEDKAILDLIEARIRKLQT